jgi:hypothetical protein
VTALTVLAIAAAGAIVGFLLALALCGGVYTQGFIAGASGLARHLAAHNHYNVSAALCAQRWIRYQQGLDVTLAPVERSGP